MKKNVLILSVSSLVFILVLTIMLTFKEISKASISHVEEKEEVESLYEKPSLVSEKLIKAFFDFDENENVYRYPLTKYLPFDLLILPSSELAFYAGEEKIPADIDIENETIFIPTIYKNKLAGESLYIRKVD